jgi:hypothetical protein
VDSDISEETSGEETEIRMIVAGIYSFNGGKEVIQSQYAKELREIRQVIAAVDSAKHKTKVSKEKTMPGRVLYKPGSLNKAFREEFEERGWRKQKVPCEYPTDYYTRGYAPPASSKGAFREIDFIKNCLGVEVQFGKYAFMVYNVCAKMTIFHKLGLIDVGVEIVPVKAFADEMSTGVSYFEQFVWDLEHRGVADIDIPVLILGIAA